MKSVLMSILIALLLVGCSTRTAQPNNIAGKYYMAGDDNCARYRKLSSTRILCIDTDGKETGYRDAMTDQELQMYMHRRNMVQQEDAAALQTLQGFNRSLQQTNQQLQNQNAQTQQYINNMNNQNKQSSGIYNVQPMGGDYYKVYGQ